MDYVYICRPGENEELRYSIRSVLTNTNCDKIWVIGSKPDWYIGNFVEVKDEGRKFDNIKTCTAVIPEIGAISKDFVLMNDDHFILKPIGEMKVYHGGLFEKKIEEYKDLDYRSQFTKLLIKTYKELIKMKIKDPLDYELHLPMPLNKDKLRETVKLPYMARSMYGNVLDLGGIEIRDVKHYSKGALMSRSFDISNTGSAFISTEDNSFNNVLELILIDKFKDKTDYER